MSVFFDIILYLIIFAVVGFVGLCIVILVITDPYPIIAHYEEEDYYYNPASDNREPFPNISEDASVNLSVVVPAYNEEDRLPPMLDEAIEFLEKRSKSTPEFKYEIIVVSDGSTDGTVALAESYSQRFSSDKVRCLPLVKNRGKGGAVRLGIQKSRGALILFADADGATTFEDLQKLEAAMSLFTHKKSVTQDYEVSEDVAIVIGSRAHLEEDCLAQRSIFRNILMYGFHFLVWLFTVKGIRDTQCGFKLFTRKAAYICFQSLHVNRWAFDVELLYIAQKLKIPITEIPVRWVEVEGSKVTPIISWIQMGLDLGLIWLKYTLGAWRIKCKTN